MIVVVYTSFELLKHLWLSLEWLELIDIYVNGVEIEVVSVWSLKNPFDDYPTKDRSIIDFLIIKYY